MSNINMGLITFITWNKTLIQAWLSLSMYGCSCQKEMQCQDPKTWRQRERCLFKLIEPLKKKAQIGNLNFLFFSIGTGPGGYVPGLFLVRDSIAFLVIVCFSFFLSCCKSLRLSKKNLLVICYPYIAMWIEYFRPGLALISIEYWILW